MRQQRELTLVPPAALRLNLEGVRDKRLGARESRRPAAGPSWWTERAKAGEVAPGFSKAELSRAPQADDPRAPGGLFDRVGELLSELLS